MQNAEPNQSEQSEGFNEEKATSTPDPFFNSLQFVRICSSDI